MTHAQLQLFLLFTIALNGLIAIVVGSDEKLPKGVRVVIITLCLLAQVAAAICLPVVRSVP